MYKFGNVERLDRVTRGGTRGMDRGGAVRSPNAPVASTEHPVQPGAAPAEVPSAARAWWRDLWPSLAEAERAGSWGEGGRDY